MNIIEIASTLVENRRNSILSEVVKVVNNADDVNITRQYGYVDHRGIYNACVMIEGFPKPFRARSEIMIFKDGKLFINHEDGRRFNSKFPGGGWDKDEDPMKSAVREAREEVRINVKNVKYIGSFLNYDTEKVAKWVKDNIPKNEWWYGYYTKLYIGEYASRYKGNIEEEDKDEMINTIRLVDIDEVYDKLNPQQKKAVDIYKESRKKS